MPEMSVTLRFKVTEPPPKRWFTISEAARLCGVNASAVSYWVKILTTGNSNKSPPKMVVNWRKASSRRTARLTHLQVRRFTVMEVMIRAYGMSVDAAWLVATQSVTVEDI